MTTKLTLTIDDEVIRASKKYASVNGTSLSDIVEHYLKTLLVEDGQSRDALSPVVQELLGCIQLPKDFNYKDALANKLTKSI